MCMVAVRDYLVVRVCTSLFKRLEIFVLYTCVTYSVNSCYSADLLVSKCLRNDKSQAVICSQPNATFYIQEIPHSSAVNINLAAKYSSLIF